MGTDCERLYKCAACGGWAHTRTVTLKNGGNPTSFHESCDGCYRISVLMPAMGEFFATLARRGEVQALRNEVLGAAHNWKACWRPEDAERRVAHWSRLKGALDRLVELAGEKRS